jgi:hypothetical protein
VNIDEPIAAEELWVAGQRVLTIQTKLHQWASDDPSRVFADLFNLATDPAFLMIAWDRVRGNQGAPSAGVDGVRPRLLQSVERAFLTGLREQVKSGEFAPLPVRERMIPSAAGSSAVWEFRPPRTEWCRPRSSWSWNRSSRRTSTCAPTGSARNVEPTTRSLRSTCWVQRL